jgi:hypothetical protein
MIGSNALGCQSRENGNPERKNQYPWIPASEGMTNPKESGFNLDSPALHFLKRFGRPNITTSFSG